MLGRRSTAYEFPLGGVTEKQGNLQSGRGGAIKVEILNIVTVEVIMIKNMLLENNQIFIDSNRTFDVFPNLCILHSKRAGFLAEMASSLNFRSAKVTSNAGWVIFHICPV